MLGSDGDHRLDKMNTLLHRHCKRINLIADLRTECHGKIGVNARSDRNFRDRSRHGHLNGRSSGVKLDGRPRSF